MNVNEISKAVFARMGSPKKYLPSAFRAALRAELEERELGADRAQYIYLFGQVTRQVEKLAARQSKKPAATSAMPTRQISLPVEYKKLAANDRD